MVSETRVEYKNKVFGVVMCSIRRWTTTSKIEKEFLEIQDNIEKHATTKKSITKTSKLYTKLSFIKPYLLILLTFALGHFGISPVTVYAVEIYLLLQVPISSYNATLLNGCVNLTGSITCVCILRYCGKRLLTFISLAGVCVCFIGAATYTYTIGVASFEDTSTETTYSWIPLVCLASMGYFSYLLIYSLPWILMGEIYYNEIRDVASGVSAASGYLIGFVANKVFLDMVNSMTLPGVFYFYSGVALIGFILLFFLLPETEGKTLFEITEHYAGGNKLDNKVFRNKSGDKNLE